MKKSIQKNSSEKMFDGQHDDEEVLYVFRKHMVSMRKGFYMLLIPFTLSALPVLIWPGVIELLLSPIIGLLIGLVLFGYQYMMWYFTVYIVTNLRVRQMMQKSFFGRDVVEVRLSQIQNISYSIPGFSGELFKYGTLTIRTLVGDLVITKVENPSYIYEKLQDATFSGAKQ